MHEYSISKFMDNDMNSNMHWGVFPSGLGFFQNFLNLVFWALIISLIVYVIQKSFKKKDNNKKGEKNDKNEDSALQILRQKYANGEITVKEYKERKNVLKDM